MNDQLFKLLLISIGGDKLAIVGLLLLLAWSAGLLGGGRGGGTVPGPSTVPVPPPPPTPPAPPLQGARGSWYSQYQGKYSWVDDGDAPNSNALGVPDVDQGISFLNRTTLGHWFEVHAPNGNVSIEQQTDIGPSASTGRGIDISAAAAERFGYSPKNFPTDEIFQWRSTPTPAAVASLSPVAQAIAYQKIRGTPAAAPPTAAPSQPAGDPSWLTLARSLIGVNENANGAKIVSFANDIAAKFPDMASYCAQYNDASIPWCGLFVAYVLAQRGFRPVFGPTDTDKFLWAPAWDDWGTAVTGDPQPGDILRFKWPGGGEHVTIYDHRVETDNNYHCTGGNQGSPGQVSTEAMPMSACVAIRRPA